MTDAGRQRVVSVFFVENFILPGKLKKRPGSFLFFTAPHFGGETDARLC
jgi:hypothetical protein